MNKNYFCEKLSKGKHGHILYIMIYIFIHEKFFIGRSLTQKRVVLKKCTYRWIESLYTNWPI